MERFCEASHKCREVALKIYTRPQGGNSTTSTDNERFQEGAVDSRMRLVDSEVSTSPRKIFLLCIRNKKNNR